MAFFKSPLSIAENLLEEETGVKWQIENVNWRETFTDGELLKGIVMLGAVATTAGAFALPSIVGTGAGAWVVDQVVAAKEQYDEAQKYGRQVPQEVMDNVAIYTDIDYKATLGDPEAIAAKEVMDATSDLRAKVNATVGEPLPHKSPDVQSGLDKAKALAAGFIKNVTGKTVQPDKPVDEWSGKVAEGTTFNRVVGDPVTRNKDALPTGQWTEGNFKTYLIWFNRKNPSKNLLGINIHGSAAEKALATSIKTELNIVRLAHGLPIKTAGDIKIFIKTGKFPIQPAKTEEPAKTENQALLNLKKWYQKLWSFLNTEWP